MRPSELPTLEGEIVACDTETSGLHVDDGARLAVVSVAWFDGADVVSHAFPFDQGPRDKLDQGMLDFDGDVNLPETEWRELLGWLAGHRLVFHNAKFDLHHLRTGTREWEGRELIDACYWDTTLAQGDLDPRESLQLKEVAERLGLVGGGERDKEQDLKTYLRKNKLAAGRYDLVPWSVIEPYAAMDAELTIRLWRYQLDRIDAGEGSYARVRHKTEVMKTLYKMEQRGIGYDAEASLEAARELRRRADELVRRLPFNPTPNGAKDWFFKRQGVMPYKTTEKGNPQLDDEVLLKLERDGYQWAKEYAEYSGLKRAVSMWYEGYPMAIGDDGRLRTTYRQTRVKSGRMSVERIQLQAIPKDDKAIDGVPTVRSLIRPAPGHQLWNLDLGQAELRVATKYAGCTRMREMLEGGADIHGVTTTEIFGIKPGHPDWKFKRDIAKRLTFGGIFQIGAKKYQATLRKLADIDLPLAECEYAVQQWRRLYPEFGWAYRKADRLATERGWVRLMPGTEYEERSWFAAHEYRNTAWNRIVQGSLALFNTIWLVETERRWPGYLVLNVHDSQVLELPDDDGEVTAKEVAEHGAALATQLFGIEMSVDVGPWHK